MRKPTDLKDKQCGLWTVLYRVENGRHGKTQWMCRCTCGAEKVVTTNSLVTNNSTSCGCNNTRDLTGQTFGDVKVLCPDYSSGRRAWRCLYSCGAVSVMSCGMLCRKSYTTCGATGRCRAALLPAHRTRSVLVVDDDVDLAATLDDAFRGEGWLTCCQSSSVAALSVARERDFDVVITDLMMPFMDGVQLCEKVTQCRPTTAVVVITGNASVRRAMDAVHAGASDFISKPFNVCDLFSSVEKAV